MYYSLGSKSKAPTSRSTTTTSTGSRSYLVPINDLIQHKYEQKNKNRKCGKMTAKLREEEDGKVVELVSKYGAKRWSLIASHLQGRIGKQCRERWSVDCGRWSSGVSGRIDARPRAAANACTAAASTIRES